jgi:hypothetical protein
MTFTNSSTASKMMASISALFASWLLITAAAGPVFVA